MSEEIKNEDVASTDSAVVETAPVAVEEKVEEVAVEATPAAAEEKVAEPVVVEAPVEAKQEVITGATKSTKPSAPKKPGLAPVDGGAIGSTVVADTKPVTAPKKSAAASVDDSVAIHSTKNVVWQGVGKVTRGVNIVSKAEADQWLTRNHVTVLTPEQVAKEFGN